MRYRLHSILSIERPTYMVVLWNVHYQLSVAEMCHSQPTQCVAAFTPPPFLSQEASQRERRRCMPSGTCWLSCLRPTGSSWAGSWCTYNTLPQRWAGWCAPPSIFCYHPYLHFVLSSPPYFCLPPPPLPSPPSPPPPLPTPPLCRNPRT